MTLVQYDVQTAMHNLPEHAQPSIDPLPEPEQQLDQFFDHAKRHVSDLINTTEWSAKVHSAAVDSSQSLGATENEDVRRKIKLLQAASKLPERRASPPKLHILQEWEGVVAHIGSDAFEMTLVDITARAKDFQEMATVPREELTDDEWRKLEVGTVIRWIIGYQTSHRRTRFSRLIIRERPNWTTNEIEWAKSAARDAVERLPEIEL
jgi:hypothetical protein